MELLNNINKNINELNNETTLDFFKFTNIMDLYKDKFSFNNNKLNELFDILSDDNIIYVDDFKNLLISLKEIIIKDLKKKIINDNLINFFYEEIIDKNINLNEFQMKYKDEIWYNLFEIIFDDKIIFNENIKKFVETNNNNNNQIIKFLNNINNNENYEKVNIVNNNILKKKISKFEQKKEEFRNILLKLTKLIENLDNENYKYNKIQEIFNYIDDIETKINDIIQNSKNYKHIIKDLKKKLNNLKSENKKIQFLIRKESLNNDNEIKILNLNNNIKKILVENENLRYKINLLLSENENLKEKLYDKNNTIKNLKKENNKLNKNIEDLNYNIKICKLNLDNKNNEIKNLNLIESKKFISIENINEEVVKDIKKEKNELSMKIIELNGQIINLSNVVNNYEHELNYFKTIKDDDIKSIVESLILEPNNDFLSIIKKNFIEYKFTDFCYLKLDNTLFLYSIKFFKNTIELKEYNKNRKITINKNDIKNIYHIIEHNFIKIFYNFNDSINLFLLKHKEFLKLLNIESIEIINSFPNNFSIFSYIDNCFFKEMVFVIFKKKLLLHLILLYNDHFIFIKLEKKLKNFDKKEIYFKKEVNLILDENAENIIIKYKNKNIYVKHLNYDRLLKIYGLMKD